MVMDKHYARVGTQIKVAVVMCLGGLVVISFINFASGADIAPWWFYILYIAACVAFWKIASFFQKT